MGEIQWGLQDPNAFQRGYQQTKGVFDEMAATREKNALEAAMRGYAMNPDDPNALNALAVADPATAITLRQQGAKHKRETAEDYRKDILIGAQVIRQVKPTDDASWQQALSAARMAGADVSKAPPNFDPQYVQGMIATADALEPQKADQPTSLERNYEFFQKTAPDLAPKYLENQANPPRFISDGMGGFTVVDPSLFQGPSGPAASQGGGPEPGTIEDGYRFKGGDPARQENWEPVDGGPTPQASGGFLP